MQVFQEIFHFVIVHLILETRNQSFSFFRILRTEISQLRDFELVQILAAEKPEKGMFEQHIKIKAVGHTYCRTARIVSLFLNFAIR